MVTSLGWDPLKERRKSHRLIMMYKVMHGLVCIPESSYMVQTNDSRTRGANRLIQHHTNIAAYKQSFFPRTKQEWNRLRLRLQMPQNWRSSRPAYSQRWPCNKQYKRHYSMYIVLTVHLDFICIKLFWILTLWHPHPTTDQVLQSSPTPDLISAQEEEELNSSCINV